MFDIEDITQKWYELGFLEQISENLKPRIALKYELVAHYLIDNDNTYGENVTMSNCIFPIIYRLYSQGKTINSIEPFIQEVDQFFINNREMMQDLNGYDIDVEAEMCTLFCERYEGVFKRTIEPIKWISKHKL